MGGLVANIGGIEHTVLQVIIEEPRRHPLQRAGERTDLGQNVDTVLLFVDHVRDAQGASLKPPEW